MTTAHDSSPPLLEQLIDQTPAHRDRAIDVLRVVSIAVVLLWHWTFAVIHWEDERLTMPNPIDDVRGLWMLTWVFQIMPLFFIVGGYANAAAYRASVRDASPAAGFIRGRLAHLTRPLAALLIVWTLLDIALIGSGVTGESVWRWGDVVFVPLWFIGVYGLISAMSPITVRLDERWGTAAAGSMLAAILLLDLGRFVGGFEIAGLVNSVLVFVFAHQLGHRWQSAAVTSIPRRTSRRLMLCGAGGLSLLVAVGPYPASMVATENGSISNMFPTTAAVAALAVLQLGFATQLAPWLRRVAQRRSVWRATVAANSIAMTVFTWHMTALIIVIVGWEAAGFELAATPTTTWWLLRPLFVFLPGLALAPLVAIFHRLERPTPRYAPTR